MGGFKWLIRLMEVLEQHCFLNESIYNLGKHLSRSENLSTFSPEKAKNGTGLFYPYGDFSILAVYQQVKFGQTWARLNYFEECRKPGSLAKLMVWGMLMDLKVERSNPSACKSFFSKKL